MLRPERICVAAPAAPRRADSDKRLSVTGTVADMIYAGPLRKYHVRLGSSLIVVREHVASGQQIFQTR